MTVANFKNTFYNLNESILYTHLNNKNEPGTIKKTIRCDNKEARSCCSFSNKKEGIIMKRKNDFIN